VNQPLRRSVVRALLAWIARAYSCSPLDALVPATLAGRHRDDPVWTEYGLYRSFAFHVAPSAHGYGDVRSVAYYDHQVQGPRLVEWLRELGEDRPSMVKVYARRPTYRLAERELRELCEQIRACR
jgi:hypothetical protein